MKSFVLRLPWLAMALATAVLGHAQPATAQTVATTDQERAAVAVVRQWFAAWEEGNLEKALSMMTDDVEFRGIPGTPLRQGKTEWANSSGRNLQNRPTQNITQALAIGGTTDTVVMIRRVVTVNPPNAPSRTLEIATMARVNRDGKIMQYQDWPRDMTALGGREGRPGGPGAGPQ